MTLDKFDYAIIGGGFFGVCIALHLKHRRPLSKIAIFEQEHDLLSRASFTNQARVHNGYHYPRSFTTAYRSRINLPFFIRDFPFAVKSDFTKLYAIAKKNSKVNSKQFSRFCREIGAPLRPADLRLKKMFNMSLIEEIFEVDEYAFNALKIRNWAYDKLLSEKINLFLSSRVSTLENTKSGIILNDRFSCDMVINSSYSGLNTLKGSFKGVVTGLKHEITEMALVKMPEQLSGVGVTVMDGPFFSFMPFPAKDAFTLSHVRYTPHLSWIDDKEIDPYEILKNYHRETRYQRMIKDAARYLPIMHDAVFLESMFEIKTVLLKNEGDDGRPILFEKDQNIKGLYSVLGGKIDNIYDVIQQVDMILEGNV